MNILISVIVPTFNHEDLLLRALESVLNQTISVYEILVVDDHSIDEINIEKYLIRDQRIKVIRHKRNKGEGASRNTGIKYSNGNIIAFLDSDDCWLNNKLELQINLLKEKGYHVGISTSYFYYKIDGKVEIRNCFVPDNWHKHLLMGNELGIGSTFIAPKEMIEKTGYFNTQLTRYTDWDWILRFVRIYQLELINLPLVNVYQYGIPSGHSVEKSNDLFIKMDMIHFQEYGLNYKKRAISQRYIEVGNYWLRSNNPIRAIIFYFKAIFQCPYYFFFKIFKKISNNLFNKTNK